GLFYKVNFRSLRSIGGVHDGALFHLGDLRGHTDDDAGVHHHLAVVRLLDEVVEHLLGVAEVGDDAVLHGLDGHDVPGGAAEHVLGLFADGLNLVGDLVYRNDGGLVDDDALAGGVDEGVGRTEIDRQIARKQAEEGPHIVNAGVTRLKVVR